MNIRVCLFLPLYLYTFSLQCPQADGQSLHQLSYSGDVMPAYRPPTTSTTTTTTVEPPTTKSSFFGGIKKWFRKTPTTEVPITSTTTTTVRSVDTGILQSSSGKQDFMTSSTTSTYKPNITPVTPTRNPSNLPSQSTSSNTQLSTPTTGGRRDYINPNAPSLSSSTAKPSIPPVTGQTQPLSPISGDRRDYINPNLSTSKPPRTKEEFPALPPPRTPPSRQVQPTSPTSTTAGQSAWNTRPGASILPTGGTIAQSWSTRPTQPASSSSGTPSGSNPVSFVPTTTRSPLRPGMQSQQGQSSPQLATDDEITALTETLFTKDVNNLNKYMTVNYQGKTRSYDSTDEAPNALLQIDSKAFDVPTVAKMKLLFNNYELDTTVNEYVTPIEKNEENEFVDEVMATSVMRQAMLFLQSKGIVTPDPKTHRELLKTIWFALYSRGGGRIGSSGFEHIFLSEIKNGTVTGLHNSLYFNEEEQKGHIDYKGYIRKVDLGNKGAIAKFRFNFNGIGKPVNAMFIGTSPELEMALYTVCFELRADKECPVSLNGNRFNLQTYTFRYRGKRLIGSAFPEI